VPFFHCLGRAKESVPVRGSLKHFVIKDVYSEGMLAPRPTPKLENHPLSVMVAKLTRLTHKIAIQLQLMTESCTICSSRSKRPVRKLLDTPSYEQCNKTVTTNRFSCVIRVDNACRNKRHIDTEYIEGHYKCDNHDTCRTQEKAQRSV
jgi:hypothetical protein